MASKKNRENGKLPEVGDKGIKNTVPTLSPVVVASIWMGLGAYVLTTFLPVALAMIGYGFSFIFSQNSEAKKLAIPVAFAILGFVLGALFPPASKLAIATGLIGAVFAFVIAGLVAKERSTLTTGFLVSGIATLLLIALEATASWMHGQTLMDTLQASVMDAVATLKPSLPLEAQAQLSTIVPVVQMLWPFSLFCGAGLCVALTHASARIAQLNVVFREKRKIQVWKLSNFDSPFWAPLLLLVGVALFFLGPVFSSASNEAAFWIQSAGLSTLLAVRFVFLLDGAGVIAWLFQKRTWGCLLRFLVLILAIYFEGIFFLVSIIGLIDFWANFRKLPRSKKIVNNKRNTKSKPTKLNQ